MMRKSENTWDLKNYVNNFIFSPNSFYFIESSRTEDTTILRKSKKLKKILRDIPKKFEK